MYVFFYIFLHLLFLGTSAEYVYIISKKKYKVPK